MASSRRYLKRVWRVPKHRGPAEYLGTLIVKALRKHGWPAELASISEQGFILLHDKAGRDFPPDFADAVDMAVRITARTYRVEVENYLGEIVLLRPYAITAGGHFKEI